jgi:hypothetical protein
MIMARGFLLSLDIPTGGSMSALTKSVPGQLLDVNNNELLAEGTVDINFNTSPNSAGHPEYKATMTIKSYKPQFSSKTYILKLGDKISGRVFITMTPTIVADFDATQTRFTLFFEDDVWRSFEWLQSL